MQSLKKLFLHIVCGSVCVATLPGISLAQAQQAVPADGSASASSTASSTSTPQLPDSPDAVLAKSAEPPTMIAQSTNTQSSTTSTSNSQTSSSQATQTQPPAQKPVGTATADAPDTSGIAASQPAGAAIAPAKQRRSRSLVIKVGAIIAGAAAVGAIVALTAGTSSKPPGAH